MVAIKIFQVERLDKGVFLGTRCESQDAYFRKMNVKMRALLQKKTQSKAEKPTEMHLPEFPEKKSIVENSRIFPWIYLFHFSFSLKFLWKSLSTIAILVKSWYLYWNTNVIIIAKIRTHFRNPISGNTLWVFQWEIKFWGGYHFFWQFWPCYRCHVLI